MEKVLFISTLLPTKLGGMRSLYYNLAEFSKRSEVHFILARCGPVEKRMLFSLPKGIIYSEIDCRRLSADPSSLLFPLQFKAMARIRSAQGKIQEYICKNKIDAVILHSMDVTFALRGLKAKVKAGYQLDSFSRYYLSKWRASHSPVAFLLAAIQLPLYAIIERVLFRNYDLLSYVSKSDASSRPSDSGKIFVLSQGRDPPLPKSSSRRDISATLFGRWEHPPNRDGLQRIAGRLGKIKGKVKIIGPNLPQGISFPPNAEPLGMVNDIDGYLSRSKVCILPVWYGAGLQTKVFDALRHGCVVATTEFTKRTFEENGFFAPSIVASDDLVACANRILKGYSQKSALQAYSDYQSFYKINNRREKEYARRIAALIRRKH